MQPNADALRVLAAKKQPNTSIVYLALIIEPSRWLVEICGGDRACNGRGYHAHEKADPHPRHSRAYGVRASEDSPKVRRALSLFI
jgi:hypothetical protein